MKKCCMCGISNKKESNRTFHKFPLNDSFVLEQWLQNLNLKNFIPKKEDILCSDHFTNDCFDVSTFRTRLKKKAIPTIRTISGSHCVSCKRKRTLQTKCSFFHFPLDNPELLQKWLENLELKNWQPTVDSVVCKRHFDKFSFNEREVGERLKLLEGSVPSKLNNTPKPGYVTCVKTEKLMDIVQEESIDGEKSPSGSPVLKSRKLVDHDHKYELSPRTLRRGMEIYEEKLKAKEIENKEKNRQIIELKQKVASLTEIIKKLKSYENISQNLNNSEESIKNNVSKYLWENILENGNNHNGLSQSSLVEKQTVILPLEEEQDVNYLLVCQELNFDPLAVESQNQLQVTVKRPSTSKNNDCFETITLDENNSDVQLNILEESKTEDINENIFRNMNTLDLTALLKKTITGQKILNKYQEKALPGKIRKVLVDLIIRSLMEIPISSDGNIKMPELKNHHFLILTKKFCAIFKKEAPDSYFIPPKTEGKNQTISRGKFVDKYRNLRTTQKELGFFDSKNSDHEEDESDINDISSSSKEHVNWLLNNDGPWSSVLIHWQLSVKIRQSEFKRPSETLKVIFDKYSILKQPLGYELIESDFKYEIGREGILDIHWPILSKKIYTLMKSEIKDKAAKELLETLSSGNISEGERDLKLLMVLPALCPPICKIRKAKTVWKPTIEEARASFILHVKSPDDIDEEIKKMREKLSNFNMSLQPLIIVVGENLSVVNRFYVNIDDTRYSFQSILQALDLCFKSFHVLHTEYPKPSEPVWLFLQKSIYSITTKWDKKFSCVASLLSAIENM
ncbi:uncharacterized protein LOC127285960 isoform X2 [Leptopilina boulardi]|uniref:uncharacterized protein LOC127285960 isoform X2 n=1 Tax=Leptopilina boulardi TaxID=63433 RepID=UPI0021F6982F|nr:uncharacterized protein LOC127285960 isoform X2 [Leptopilina boulardi]